MRVLHTLQPLLAHLSSYLVAAHLKAACSMICMSLTQVCRHAWLACCPLRYVCPFHFICHRFACSLLLLLRLPAHDIICFHCLQSSYHYMLTPASCMLLRTVGQPPSHALVALARMSRS